MKESFPRWPGQFQGAPAPPAYARELKADGPKIRKALKEDLKSRTVRVASKLP